MFNIQSKCSDNIEEKMSDSVEPNKLQRKMKTERNQNGPSRREKLENMLKIGLKIAQIGGYNDLLQMKSGSDFHHGYNIAEYLPYTQKISDRISHRYLVNLMCDANVNLDWILNPTDKQDVILYRSTLPTIKENIN
jgi:hypothetical protein